MVATQPGSHSRSIITISSANAFVVSTNRAEYCCRKRTLHDEQTDSRSGSPTPASAASRWPGIIRTDMTMPATERYDKLIAEGVAPIRRWGEAEDIGRGVAMLAAGDLPFATGDVLHIDGGLHMRVL